MCSFLLNEVILLLSLILNLIFQLKNIFSCLCMLLSQTMTWYSSSLINIQMIFLRNIKYLDLILIVHYLHLIIEVIFFLITSGTWFSKNSFPACFCPSLCLKSEDYISYIYHCSDQQRYFLEDQKIWITDLSIYVLIWLLGQYLTVTVTITTFLSLSILSILEMYLVCFIGFCFINWFCLLPYQAYVGGREDECVVWRNYFVKVKFLEISFLFSSERSDIRGEFYLLWASYS